MSIAEIIAAQKITKRSIGCVVVGQLIITLLLLSSSCSLAADSMLRRIDLCNGADRALPDSQIRGCAELIDSRALTSLGLAVAYNNRGNAYVAEGKYDRAIADYDRSLELNPLYVRAYNNRGVAYEKKGNYDHAIENFDAAIALDGQYASALANRAEVLMKKRDYARAAKDLDAALQIRPNLKEGWSGRCWVRAQIGEINGALKDCNEALELGSSATAYDSRGFVYLKMNRWDSAIADYNAALKLDPKLASSFYGRGLAKLKKGDMSGGNMDLAAAKALDADIAVEFKQLGL